MAENIYINKNLTKEEKYRELIPQIKNLISGEPDIISNMANISSALFFEMNFLWAGFYSVKENSLVLGPFHGPVACTRINFGKGVCGTAWEQAKTIIVPDVDKFPGHIACSSLSKSEIVIPGIKNNKVLFVLDIDSTELNTFDDTDKKYLEDLINFVIENLN